jgi:hypothetical protein
MYGSDTPEMTLRRCRTAGQDILSRFNRIKKELTESKIPFDLYGIEFDANRIIELTESFKNATRPKTQICGDNCNGECSGEVDGIPSCPNKEE